MSGVSAPFSFVCQTLITHLIPRHESCMVMQVLTSTAVHLFRGTATSACMQQAAGSGHSVLGAVLLGAEGDGSCRLLHHADEVPSPHVHVPFSLVKETATTSGVCKAQCFDCWVKLIFFTASQHCKRVRL